MGLYRSQFNFNSQCWNKRFCPSNLSSRARLDGQKQSFLFSWDLKWPPSYKSLFQALIWLSSCNKILWVSNLKIRGVTLKIDLEQTDLFLFFFRQRPTAVFTHSFVAETTCAFPNGKCVTGFLSVTTSLMNWHAQWSPTAVTPLSLSALTGSVLLTRLCVIVRMTAEMLLMRSTVVSVAW